MTRVVKYRELEQLLLEYGFSIKRGSSRHIIFYHAVTKAIVALPSNRKVIPRSSLVSIIKLLSEKGIASPEDLISELKLSD